MSVKISYSQANTYITCPQAWAHQYVNKWENPIEGSSTYFGSAIDAAVGEMLEGKQDWLKTFYDRWNKSWSFGKSTQIFDNPDIVFGHKDFDQYVLEPKDYPQLEIWAKQLNLLPSTTVPTPDELVQLYKQCSDAKKNPYKHITKDQLIYFNRASWLSMKRKGKVLLEAFKVQFYPKVKKVLATQQRATIKDQVTGDSITGFIDFVVELEGFDKPIILDLKTASMPYNQQDIDLTQQLVIYSAMKGAEYNTDLVGYVVLCKNIPKNSVFTCTSCGHVKTGRHKTCDNVINGNRCGGSWLETVTPEPVVQILIEQKTQEQINAVLSDYGNIIFAMKNGIVYKNTSKCANMYGAPCQFYDLCHKGDSSGLRKRS